MSKIIVETIFEEIQLEREGQFVDWQRLQKILHVRLRFSTLIFDLIVLFQYWLN